MLMGQVFCTKYKIIHFEENKFNERFGECLGFFYIKRPINVESHMYEVTNEDRTYLSSILNTYFKKS